MGGLGLRKDREYKTSNPLRIHQLRPTLYVHSDRFKSLSNLCSAEKGEQVACTVRTPAGWFYPEVPWQVPGHISLSVQEPLQVVVLTAKLQDRPYNVFSLKCLYAVSVVCLQVNKGMKAQLKKHFLKPDLQHSVEGEGEELESRMREFPGTGIFPFSI